MWDPDPSPWLVQLARCGIRPWELDLLTYDDFLVFTFRFRTEPTLGGVV